MMIIKENLSTPYEENQDSFFLYKYLETRGVFEQFNFLYPITF